MNQPNRIFIDFETLTLGGYQKYKPIQYGSVGYLNNAVVPPRSTILPVAGAGRGVREFMNSMGMDTTFIEEAMSGPSNQFKDLIERVGKLSGKVTENDRYIKTLKTIFGDFERMLPEGGNVLAHGNIDFNVISEIFNSLDMSDESNALREYVFNKFWDGDKSKIEGFNRVGNRINYTGKRTFLNRAMRTYDFADFKDMFDKLHGVYSAPVKGKIGTLNTIDYVTSILGMAEEKEYLTTLSPYVTKGSSVSTLVKAFSQLDKDNPFYNDIFKSGVELHLAESDAKQADFVVSTLSKIGKKISNGEELDKHELAVLSNINKVRFDEVAGKISEDTEGWFRSFGSSMPTLKDRQNIVNKIERKYGTPFKETAERIYDSIDLEYSRVREGNEQLTHEEVLERAFARSKPKVRTAPLPDAANIRNWKANFCQGASSPEVAATRAAAGAAGEAEHTFAKIGARATKFVQKNPAVGLFTAGMGLLTFLKVANWLKEPNFRELVNYKDEHGDAEVPALYPSMRPDRNPFRIISNSGAHAVMSKIIAGFGSPMAATLRETIEFMAKVPKAKRVKFVASLVEHSFVNTPKIVSPIKEIEGLVSYLNDKEVVNAKVWLNNRSGLLNHIPNLPRESHSRYPRFIRAVPGPSLKKMDWCEHYDQFNTVLTVNLAKAKQRVPFEEAYLRNIGLYDITPQPKIELSNVAPPAGEIYHGIDTRMNQYLNTFTDFSGNISGFSSDFASPASKNLNERPSLTFLKSLMIGYNADVAFKIGNPDMIISSIYANYNQNKAIKQRVMEDTYWYSKPADHTGVLISATPDNLTTFNIMRTRHRTKLQSMIYYDGGGAVCMRPLDSIEIVSTHVNYKSPSRSPQRSIAAMRGFRDSYTSNIGHMARLHMAGNGEQPYNTASLSSEY